MPDLDNVICHTDSLHVWFCANVMALNPDKSEAILLGTHQRAHSYSNLATVNVTGDLITLADQLKILGVTLDKNLSMNNHVNECHLQICSLSYPCPMPQPFPYI